MIAWTTRLFLLLNWSTRIHLRQSEKVALQLIRCKRKVGCDSASSYWFLQWSSDANFRPLATGWTVKFHIFTVITFWVCYAVLFAKRDFLVTPRTFPAHFCFAFSSSLIGFLEYLTYATDIFPRLSPLTCVLIGLLFCLDYATFFPCLSLWLAFSLRFDWFIGFFVGKAISFCLVLILRQTWLIDTKREAAKL